MFIESRDKFLTWFSPMFPTLDTISATLNFFDGRSPETGYRWVGSNESERPLDLSPSDSHEVLIHDLRKLSATERGNMGLTLEEAGFEAVQGWGLNGAGIQKAWGEGKWNDQSWIETEYYSYVKKYRAYLFPSD